MEKIPKWFSLNASPAMDTRSRRVALKLQLQLQTQDHPLDSIQVLPLAVRARRLFCRMCCQPLNKRPKFFRLSSSISQTLPRPKIALTIAPRTPFAIRRFIFRPADNATWEQTKANAAQMDWSALLTTLAMRSGLNAWTVHKKVTQWRQTSRLRRRVSKKLPPFHWGRLKMFVDQVSKMIKIFKWKLNQF